MALRATALFIAASRADATAATLGARLKELQEPESAKYEQNAKDQGMSDKSNNRIGVVTDTLKEILATVQEQERTDAGLYKCFHEWCRSELEETTTAYDDTKDELVETETLEKADDAAVVSLQSELRKNADERAEIKESLDQSENLREDDHDEFTEDSTANDQAIGQVARAIELVGDVHKQGGFLQRGKLRRMALNEPGESKFVLGIMKGIEAKLLRTKKEIRDAEDQKVEQYDDFTGTKKDQATSLKDDFAEKQLDVNDKKVTRAEAKNEIQDLTDEEKELSDKLLALEHQCERKTDEWHEKSVDRQSEKAALRQAIAFLDESQKETEAPAPAPTVALAQESADAADDDSADSFVQLTASAEHRHRHRQRRHRASRRPPAAKPLVQAPTTAASSALVQAADAQFTALLATVQSHEKKEGFAGAIQVVKDLIASLQAEQVEEDKLQEYCKAEIPAKDEEQVATEDKLEKTNANIEKRESDIEVLNDEISKLRVLMNESAANLVEANELRNDESAAFTKGSKERALAIKVLAQAKVVLKAFYEKPQRGSSLAQARALHHKTRREEPETWSDGGKNSRQSVKSSGAILMLDKVADDVQKEQRDVDKVEHQSVRSFRKFEEESRLTRDDRQEQLTAHSQRRGKSLGQVNNLKEDKTSIEADLEAVKNELVGLHSECDDMLQHHDQRLEARSFEIAQLRDVIDILSGSSASARTGLLSTGATAAEERLVKQLQHPEAAQKVSDRNDALLDLSQSIHGLALKARALAQQ